MVEILDLITQVTSGRLCDGLASGRELGYGSHGRVHTFDCDEGVAGSKLVWLTKDYTPSPLGLVVKRSRQNLADRGYGGVHELEVSRHLRHPNVVEIVAMHLPPSESAQQLGLVMPQALGTVADLFYSEDTGLVRRVLAEILTGLEYVHDSGFIHRDLKSENILIYDEGVRLADFGASVRDTGRPLYPMMTTYMYCAPEEASAYYGRAVDLWSFGCIAFELICCATVAIESNCENAEYSNKLLNGLVSCPCIQTTAKELINLGFKPNHVAALQGQIKDKAISWTEYIDGLGFLDRAIAITGGISNLEHLLGGLFCMRPERRLTIPELRAMPMFQKILAPLPVSPRLVWKGSALARLHPDFLDSVAEVADEVHEEEPWNLAFLFTANCLYSTCLASFDRCSCEQDIATSSTEELNCVSLFSRLYITCLMVARSYHGLYHYRSDLIGHQTSQDQFNDYNKLEAFVLITCFGLMDQETSFDRNLHLKSGKKILELYLSETSGTLSK